MHKDPLDPGRHPVGLRGPEVNVKHHHRHTYTEIEKNWLYVEWMVQCYIYVCKESRTRLDNSRQFGKSQMKHKRLGLVFSLILVIFGGPTVYCGEFLTSLIFELEKF